MPETFQTIGILSLWLLAGSLTWMGAEHVRRADRKSIINNRRPRKAAER